MSLADTVREAEVLIWEKRQELFICPDSTRKKQLRADIANLELMLHRAEKWLESTKQEEEGNDTTAQPTP
jgi:hypothetical protein